MRILFQGDSITDCHRNRDDFWDLGEGYVKYTASALKEKYPDIDFEFINRGIGGNRTENLLARINEDLIDLKPDIVTLMIGLNDTWHRYQIDLVTDIDYFRSNLTSILEKIKNETNAKLIMMEPFLLYDMGKDEMRPDLDEKIVVFHQLALKYADCFISIDGKFTEARVNGVDKYDLSPDGVHPGEAGKKLIANELVPIISKVIDELK